MLAFNQFHMLATAHIVYDRQYFEMLYDDWLQHRSVWRRYAVYASFALLAAGVMMAVASPRHWLVGAVFAMFGVYETISALTYRRRWIGERLLLARADKTVDLTFDETSVASASANGKSTMLISGFVGFVAGTKGFFLIPDTGIFLYVPRPAVEPASVYDTLVHCLCLAVQKGSESQTASGEQNAEHELPNTGS
ncbi:MAG: hypothetical protein WCK86_13060 [Planctomycetia bacterium]